MPYGMNAIKKVGLPLTRNFPLFGVVFKLMKECERNKRFWLAFLENSV